MPEIYWLQYDLRHMFKVKDMLMCFPELGLMSLPHSGVLINTDAFLMHLSRAQGTCTNNLKNAYKISSWSHCDTGYHSPNHRMGVFPLISVGFGSGLMWTAIHFVSITDYESEITYKHSNFSRRESHGIRKEVRYLTKGNTSLWIWMCNDCVVWQAEWGLGHCVCT